MDRVMLIHSVKSATRDEMNSWPGKESLSFDRFKAVPLPPGAARSPDDWAPVTTMPGAPKESPEFSGPAAAREYAGAAGQSAWRRTLAPRHQSVVKKYFENPR